MVRVRLVLLCFLLTSVAGMSPTGAQKINVMAGESVVLRCPLRKEQNQSDAKVIWTSHTAPEMDLTDNLSLADKRQMLVHERRLVILKASINHQGNYSCSLGNARRWFSVTVYTTQTKGKCTTRCYTQKSCTMNCPVGIIPNLPNNSTIWQKKGESLPKSGYFPRVTENDRGVYTCTTPYLYHGQIYNVISSAELCVEQSGVKENARKAAKITSPNNGDVFYKDLGSTVVINCIAEIYDEADEVSWFSRMLDVPQNESLPVFYNSTRYENKGMKMMASLVFKKLSIKDLSENYTCLLESNSQPPSSVTIRLVQKSHISYIPLALGISSTVVVMVLTVVIYVRFKIHITLFLRDTLGCHRHASDGKSYDAFLMSYKSDTDAGLNAYDRKWLQSVLEDSLGYSLCIYDRDVLPGQAVADAVLDCIEQSRTVVLVPTSPDPGLGSSLPSAIHEAVVERQTHLIWIKAEGKEESRSPSLPESLQFLGKSGHCVTWRGRSSIPPSSSFWRQLRYHLPAAQHAPNINPLPQTV